MFSEFLKSNTTYPTELRDFFEWHKGVKYFGFWAIEVTDLECLEKIGRYQKHLAHRLHPDYARQPHITLATSGLMSNEYFHTDLISKKIEQISKKNLHSFTLQLSHCDSFSTCPYLKVYDAFSSLTTIRKCLNEESKENDNPAQYTPHITLGFYKYAYKTADIVNEISELNIDDREFVVREIVFAQYETKDVQGPYKVLHRIKLDDTKDISSL
ncbi:MAG: 2'-5' RNA ligase family protein [Arcobacteraceae bacterium]